MNTALVFDAEQAMAHLAAIVEFSNDAIVSKTLDGTIVTWNRTIPARSSELPMWRDIPDRKRLDEQLRQADG